MEACQLNQSLREKGLLSGPAFTGGTWVSAPILPYALPQKWTNLLEGEKYLNQRKPIKKKKKKK